MIRATGLVLARFILVACFFSVANSASAQVTAFRQAVAESVARDTELAGFYRDREFQGVWTGSDSAARNRRNALLTALADAGAHGLPQAEYDPDRLMAELRAAQAPAQQGAMEVRLSQVFLQYARDVQTGILTPGREIDQIKREVPLRSRLSTINAFAQSNPAAFLRSLPPSSPEYGRLLVEKLRMEQQLAQGGYGPVVPVGSLAPGASGAAVVALRDRLIAMGHLGRTATQTYDATVQSGVQRFQQAMGLSVDGVAGSSTMEQINMPMERRMQSVIVAMERERWINRPRGARHIWVNLTDFTAAIVDNDRVTFSTRSVIGARDVDRRTPEFSDVMDHMVINPTWYVPRSIVVGEYLPQLQRNPGAVSHLDVTDRAGRVVPRGSVNASAYTARTFPYAMRQGPSPRNALGLVKFMFPNKYNIYLHDTPAKNLFGQSVRAFSHGCIRLNDPFDFAYALLARQEGNPEAFFQSRLKTGSETRVNLNEPVPVHIVYRTAFTHVTGKLQFRSDIYGRDAQIWNALAREGVAIRAVQG
ncbi:L,D-transpeptidase family protein [Loktanella sp. SALINAS62]|uniref:L,D-transpeptidase family protein n=1 Tax=Loktanella sp. SALINAS62 TaxID=2706124 RepID=UPI001B8D1E48|nr:L,D-transpeptidase family protein [Loktanella sp. SALINAS62]MBS1303672.1 L,D-transpeptidase family protein [Loktanella sp. SALINAS62]